MRAFLALACVCVFVTAGCGGGGGGSSTGGGGGRPPVAADPTCNGIVASIPKEVLPQITSGAGVIVPASSVQRASSSGPVAHTNHLILASSTHQNIKGVAPSGTPAPDGLNPVQMRGAYGVPDGGGAGGAIAIVDAFDYPTSLADFNVFSTQFGLPTETSVDATNAANTVFQVVYATGSKPSADGGWAQEEALDTQWAHAMAPAAKIYLVEAATPSVTDLMAAVNVAKNLPGVKQVSMSWGVHPESGCMYVQNDSSFLSPGVTFFAASGDTAGERDFPALSSNVVAVGGTHLSVRSDGLWLGETVWNDTNAGQGTGCGHSGVEPRPVFQDKVYSLVGLFRTGNDISADGDPNTGVAVYDSTVSGGFSGWLVFGGTSLSTPVIAGIVASSGATIDSSKALNTLLYAGIKGPNFHDVVSGSAGGFTAKVGYDIPSGVGTPNGLGTFISAGARP